MTRSGTIRIAVIGTGRIAQAHVRGRLSHDGAELAILCDVRAEAVEATKAQRAYNP